MRDTAHANLTIWWTMNPMYQPIALRISRLTKLPTTFWDSVGTATST